MGYPEVIQMEGERATRRSRPGQPIETVPETERQAAMAELRPMGYELEISADRKQIRQKWIAGTPKLGLEALRKTTPRYMTLLQAVHGTRKRFEILAKSKEF
jgi:hypothetical protein